jgi:anhydro-N-acetylmuramic acid kinase
MKLTVIGLMSGTSYDAVDAAAAEFELDGEEITCRPSACTAFPGRPGYTLAWTRYCRQRPTAIGEVCQLGIAIGQLFGAVAAGSSTASSSSRPAAASRWTPAEFAPLGARSGPSC